VTFVFADVVRGFLDGDAVGAGEEGMGRRHRARAVVVRLWLRGWRAAGLCPAGQPRAVVPTWAVKEWRGRATCIS
jgi:hypothetical protein